MKAFDIKNRIYFNRIQLAAIRGPNKAKFQNEKIYNEKVK